MASTLLTTEAAREVLLEGLDDYLGLWEFVASVRDNGTTDPQAVREEAIGLVREILDADFAEAGFPTRDGRFTVESSDATEVAERVSREWDELGREPDIWEIIWFRLTEKGREYARRLDSAA